MRRKLLCLTAIICVAIVSQAQKFDVKWGEKAKLFKNDYSDAVEVSKGNSIVLHIVSKAGMFQSGKTKYFLKLVDKEYEPITETEIEFEQSYVSDVHFEKFKNAIYLFYSGYNKSDKTTSSYAVKIDPVKATMGKTTTLGTFESDKMSDQADISIQVSNDSSKIMVFAEGPERKKENKKYFIGVFDNELNKIWKREVELPIQEKYIYIYDKDFTDDGNVYVALKHYDKEVTKQSVREEGKKVPSYVYKLIKYNEKEDKEIKFDLSNNFIQGTKIIYNNQGLLSIAGLYKKKHNGNITGVFYTTLNPKTNEISNKKMVDFDAEIIRLIDKDGFGSDKESDPGLDPEFRINFIINRDNGSVDLVCEYYQLIIYTTTTQRGGTQTTYRYQYGDILNTNISKDGKITFTRVPKNQKFSNYNAFMGYYALPYKDKLVLIYNDDKDNVDRDLEKKPDDVMKFNKSALVAATIDSKGNLTREAIADNDDEDYVPGPRFMKKSSATKYLITADLLKIFKRKTRIGTIEIK
jgi:hypothetical protein